MHGYGKRVFDDRRCCEEAEAVLMEGEVRAVDAHQSCHSVGTVLEARSVLNSAEERKMNEEVTTHSDSWTHPNWVR